MKWTREQRGWVLLAVAALVALAFHQLGDIYADWALGLGSVLEPTPRHLLFLFYFTFFATVCVPLVAIGMLWAFHEDDWWSGWEDAWFLPRAVLVALLLPVVLRVLVLGGQPITDDESLYRFGAELLLRGQVAAESHPMKLFFDHAFLVNDGSMFSQYFLGWPAFLSLGVALGVPGFVNAVLSALTLPPLYLLVKELTDRLWAQVVALLFILSPMLQLLAATELSHTSALFALTWTAWLAFKAVSEPAKAWPAGLLGLAFSVAFFVRPLTALGIGGPFLAYWGWGWWRSERRLAPVAAFLGPSLALGALFLLVNQLQTGSALKPAYMAWQEYARANAFRFSGLNPQNTLDVPNLGFQGVATSLRTVFLGLVRLGYALLGWPLALLFLPLALGARRAWALWGSMAVFLLLHLPLRDVGIDTVGPVHFTELALPILVLTGVGLQRGAEWIRLRVSARAEEGVGHELGRRVVLATVAGLLLGNLVLYSPPRLKAVSVTTTLVGVPPAVIEQAGVENAVVFSTVPWAAACNPAIPVPSRPFVFWWPVNEPGFTDDILHANHLSVERDRALMAEHFPDRTGWVLRWTDDCRLDLVRLDDPAADDLPNGMMVGGRAATRYDDAHPPTGEVPSGFSP